MKAKEWFYKTRYYLLGLLVMYCAVRRTFRPNYWLFFIEMIGLIIFLTIFIRFLSAVLKKRKELGYRELILPLFCLLTIVLSVRFLGPLGVAIRDKEFRARIVDYNSVVDAIKAGKVPSNKHGDDLQYPIDLTTFNLPPTVQEAIGIRREDCELVVYFVTCHLGGALGPHMGFVYIEKLGKTPCKEPFPSYEHLTPMTGNWFSYFHN